jgi:hypothetical protein
VKVLGPHVRLALSGGNSTLENSLKPDPLRSGLNPALLCSYVYMKHLEGQRHKYAYRDWSLDSGAFSAFQLGITIDIQEYIDRCKELFATDPTLTECFSLDVIGDWRGSEKNTETIWKAGVPAIPVYHYGEPEALLKHLASAYPKIAIGGAVGLHKGQKMKWAEQCFARVWPTKIHGLGFGSETAVMTLPFHSVDATNWQASPSRFGKWMSFGKATKQGTQGWGNLSVKCTKHFNVQCEVNWYLALERRAQSKWRKEMEQLER